MTFSLFAVNLAPLKFSFLETGSLRLKLYGPPLVMLTFLYFFSPLSFFFLSFPLLCLFFLSFFSFFWCPLWPRGARAPKALPRYTPLTSGPFTVLNMFFGGRKDMKEVALLFIREYVFWGIINAQFQSLFYRNLYRPTILGVARGKLPEGPPFLKPMPILFLFLFSHAVWFKRLPMTFDPNFTLAYSLSCMLLIFIHFCSRVS